MKAVRNALAVCALLWTASRAPGDPGSPTNGVAAENGIEATADRIEYRRDRCLFVALGNVTVKGSGERLRADRATVRTDTGEAWASGNVVFEQGDKVWTGERIFCNFDTGRIVGEGRSKFSAPPFVAESDAFERTDAGVVSIGSETTTCAMDPQHRHYCIRAARVYMAPGKSVSAWHAILCLWGIPVAYVPYWEQNIDGYGMIVRPGYASDMGVYLLAGYRYRIAGGLDGTTRVDYRGRRGWGLGQDFAWSGREGNHAGTLLLYHTRDRDPAIGNEGALDTLGDNRYRIRFEDGCALGPRTRLLARFHYVSDSEVLDDFFRPEYRVEPQPVNYISLTHRGDACTAVLTARPRLNGFYEAVTRLPELSLEMPMREVPDWGCYYEGRHAGVYLEKLWPDSATNASYSSLRVDSKNMFYVSRKWGFLNIEPRVGCRGTYYSDTPAGGEDGNPGENGSAFRSVFEAGLQLSFKAYKILRPSEPGREGLRHVAEPYMNWTCVPEPNVPASGLYQFDDTDSLGRQATVRMGVRNKLQARRDKPFDLADVDIWTEGNFGADGTERVFNLANIDAEIRPWSKLEIDCDAKFGLQGAFAREFNTRLAIGDKARASANIEYRFRRDENSLLTTGFAYSPGKEWTYSYDLRFEFDESRLEEQNLWIQRNYDCMSIAAGFNHVPSYEKSDGSTQDAEYRFMIRLWLTAFPKIGIFMD